MTQYAVAARVISKHSTTTNAGSSLAHWFLVCLWYDVCRYLQSKYICLYCSGLVHMQLLLCIATACTAVPQAWHTFNLSLQKATPEPQASKYSNHRRIPVAHTISRLAQRFLQKKLRGVTCCRNLAMAVLLQWWAALLPLGPSAVLCQASIHTHAVLGDMHSCSISQKVYLHIP